MQLCVQADRQIKLLELTPEIELALNNDELTFRADRKGDNVVLTTKTQTYSLRRLNQTNTILICQSEESLNARAAPAYILEPRKSCGFADFDLVPYLNPSMDGNHLSVEDVRMHSPCSDLEFQQQWHENAGVVLNGSTWRVSEELVCITLDRLIQCLRLNEVRIDGGREIVHSALQNLLYDDASGLNLAVYNKFSSAEGLDGNKIAIYYGRSLLEKADKTVYDKEDFLEQWRRKIWFMEWELNLNLLKGYFLEVSKHRIRAFNPKCLSSDPETRLKQLLSLKSEWSFEELKPFLVDSVPPNRLSPKWIAKLADRRAGKFVRRN